MIVRLNINGDKFDGGNDYVPLAKTKIHIFDITPLLTLVIETFFVSYIRPDKFH